MVIYLDIIFLENSIMNVLILLSMRIILKNKKDIWRIILSAIVGALFYVIEFVITWIVFIQVLIAVLILIIAFGYSNIRTILKQVVLFYFISLLFGGISFWLMNLLNNGNYSIYNGIIVGNFSFILVTISGIVGLVLTIIFLNQKMRHVISSMIIVLNSKKAFVNVLLDTGNLLREPYKNRPVLIVEKMALSDFLTDEVMSNYHDIIMGRIQIPRGMFFIPYKSLGNSGGYLLGIKPDYIILEDTGQKCREVVIGICDDIICENGRYSGIIGLDIFEGGKSYEYC